MPAADRPAAVAHGFPKIGGGDASPSGDGRATGGRPLYDARLFEDLTMAPTFLSLVPRLHRVLLLLSFVAAPLTAQMQWSSEAADWGRSEAVIAYEPASGSLIRSGGDSNGWWGSDTSRLTSGGWTVVSSSGPLPRRYPSMWADPVLGRTYLFGGDAGRSGGGYMNDTWSWDGTSWTQLLATSAAPGGPVVFDMNRARAVMVSWTSPSGVFQ